LCFSCDAVWLVGCTWVFFGGRGFVFCDYWVREGEVLPAWAFGLRVTLLDNLPTKQLNNLSNLLSLYRVSLEWFRLPVTRILGRSWMHVYIRQDENVHLLIMANTFYTSPLNRYHHTYQTPSPPLYISSTLHLPVRKSKSQRSPLTRDFDF
jgi:hypothetical protein